MAEILTRILTQPLGNIELSASLLLKEAKLHEDETIRELLEVIIRSTKKSVTMLNDVINNPFFQQTDN